MRIGLRRVAVVPLPFFFKENTETMGRLEASILSSLVGVSPISPTPTPIPAPIIKVPFRPEEGFLNGSESWSSQEASERT